MLTRHIIETELRCALVDREDKLTNLAEGEHYKEYWTTKLKFTKEIRALLDDCSVLTLLQNAKEQEKFQNGPR